MTTTEIAALDRREQCYCAGHREAKKDSGKYPESMVQGRSLTFKYPNEYLQGYKAYMTDHRIYFPEDMTQPANWKNEVDLV